MMIGRIRMWGAGLMMAALVTGCCCKCRDCGDGQDRRKDRGAEKATYRAFGDPLTIPERETVPVKKVLAAKSTYDGRELRMSGKVASVCVRKGCWIRMTDGTEEVFVKFTCPIDGRLIPMEAVGREAVVQGKLSVTQLSEAAARHYAEDAGASPEEIAKIKGPQNEIVMAGRGALIIGMQ